MVMSVGVVGVADAMRSWMADYNSPEARAERWREHEQRMETDPSYRAIYERAAVNWERAFAEKPGDR